MNNKAMSKKNQSKYRPSRYIAFSLILSMVLSAASPAFAITKGDATPPPKEIIYGILGEKSELQRAFQVVVDDVVENKSSIQNTTETTLENPQLPWTFETTYRLDHVNITPSGLAGKKGELDFEMVISKAQEVAKPSGSVDAADYDTHAVQVVISLPVACTKDLRAPGATVAYKGDTLQLVYLVLPGQNQRVGFSAEIKDFEMDPILISALPMSLDNTLDSTLEDTPSARESRAQLDDLYKGTQALADGTAAFKRAMSQVKGGADQLQASGSQLHSGLGELAKGSADLRRGAAQLHISLKQLSEGLSAEQRANQPALEALLKSNQAAISGLEAQVLDLPKEAKDTPQAKALGDTLALLKANQQTLKAQQAGAEVIAQKIGLIVAGSQTLSLGLVDLDEGLKATHTGFSHFLVGLNRLQQGLGTLLQKSTALKSGAKTLNAELIPVKQDLYHLLNRLEALEPMLDADSSDRQYVLRTEGIYLPEADVVATPPAKPTLWEKLRVLFGGVFR